MNTIIDITPYINITNGVQLTTDKKKEYRLCITGSEIGTDLPYHVTITTISEIPERIVYDFYMDKCHSISLDDEIITFKVND